MTMISGVYGILILVCLSSCSYDGDYNESSHVKSSFSMSCSQNGEWSFSKDDKEYTIGSLLSVSHNERAFSIQPISGEIQDWETWHALVMRRLDPPPSHYVLQPSSIDGIDSIQGMATREITTEDIQMARRLAIDTSKLREQFKDYVIEESYLDSKIGQDNHVVQSIYNIYVQESNYVGFSQLARSSTTLQRLEPFKTQLAEKMVQVAKSSGIYLVNVRQNQFLWNIEHAKWMLKLSDSNFLVGRSQLIFFLEKNKNISRRSEELLYKARQKDEFGSYKELDQKFFLDLLEE